MVRRDPATRPEQSRICAHNVLVELLRTRLVS
jgi:hypothetical protein